MRGTVLAAWRKELGWTQERLATELGVEQQMIDDWERSPNITPLVELVTATLRSALAAMRTVKTAPDTLIARARPSADGVIRAARRR